VVIYGSYDLILDSHEEIYAFTRTLDTDRLLVILNFSRNSPAFNLPEDITFMSMELLLNNYEVNPDEDIHKITLRPYEARVYRLK
jgi:oligo-1,6-glucosidase